MVKVVNYIRKIGKKGGGIAYLFRKLGNRLMMSHSYQKNHWEDNLKKYDHTSSDKCPSYSWGDPESDSNDGLGNYKFVKELLLKNISNETVVLEIGAFSGKWTQYMLSAKKIIAVDVNEYFSEYLSNKYPKCNNLSFYTSKGNELKGIGVGEVDLVFSMDSFSRVSKKFIFDYFKEISRVLSKDGQAIICLPNYDLPASRNKEFTKLTTKQIKTQAELYFSSFYLDSSTLKHSSILVAKK